MQLFFRIFCVISGFYFDNYLSELAKKIDPIRAEKVCVEIITFVTKDLDDDAKARRSYFQDEGKELLEHHWTARLSRTFRICKTNNRNDFLIRYGLERA